MDTKQALVSQYRAALDMLAKAIRACPDDLWIDESFQNRSWSIAYHTLFYTHLYLAESEETFVPWAKHRENAELFGKRDYPPFDVVELPPPYSKAEVLEYLTFCIEEVETRVPPLDLSADSGFPWIPFSKHELMIYNIRHVQHHAGQLTERVRVRTGKGLDEAGMDAI